MGKFLLLWEQGARLEPKAIAHQRQHPLHLDTYILWFGCPASAYLPLLAAWDSKGKKRKQDRESFKNQAEENFGDYLTCGLVVTALF